MTNKVILVTEPDDVLVDGLRILLVNLTADQTQIISDSLSNIKQLPTVVFYIWNQGSPDWLFDKKQKSSAIIFNADSENEIITGYMSAQKNSAYFGTLRDLSLVNTQSILDEQSFVHFFNTILGNYEQ